MAGVDDDYKKYNKDKTTEHFIVIVGMGEDSDGKYFLFYDNAIGDATIGASSDNKLYCKCIEQKLIGEGDLNNSYLHGYVDPFGVFRDPTAKDQYIVTQIRKTK